MSVKPRKGGLFDRLFGRSEKPAEQEPDTRQEEVAVPPATDEQLGPIEDTIDRSESAAEAAPPTERGASVRDGAGDCSWSAIGCLSRARSS